MNRQPKKHRASERILHISSPTLSGHFAVWVTVWVKPDFTGFHEVRSLKWYIDLEEKFCWVDA